MKLKAFLTRRRYLVKIASTCIIFLLVPCMVALGLFLGVARGQLESANEEYYHNTISVNPLGSRITSPAPTAEGSLTEQDTT